MTQSSVSGVSELEKKWTRSKHCSLYQSFSDQDFFLPRGTQSPAPDGSLPPSLPAPHVCSNFLLYKLHSLESCKLRSTCQLPCQRGACCALLVLSIWVWESKFFWLGQAVIFCQSNIRKSVNRMSPCSPFWGLAQRWFLDGTVVLPDLIDVTSSMLFLRRSPFFVASPMGFTLGDMALRSARNSPSANLLKINFISIFYPNPNNKV